IGTTISKGEWGTLDELEIPLGNQDELFADRPTRLRPTAWLFENYSKEQLEALLQACNLTEVQWRMLQQTNVVTIGDDGILFAPPNEFVWTLNPRSRAKLYAELGKSGVNYCQNSPFRFTAERWQERLAAT